MNSNQAGNRSYFSQGSLGRKRWASYYYQIDAAMQLSPRSILEIGLGNHVVSDYLRRRIPAYYSLDIDHEAFSSVQASVTSIPFRDGAFDVVLCAEVLEHLPFEAFDLSLRELRRVSAGYVVLSLPQAGAEIGFHFNLPYLGSHAKGMKISLHRKRGFDGLHYWEINRGGYPITKIRNLIISSGFSILSELHPYDMLYNHFFVLKKTL